MKRQQVSVVVSSSLTKQPEVPQGLRPIHDLLTSRGWNPSESSSSTDKRYHIVTSSHPRLPTPTDYKITYIKDPSSEDEFRIRTQKDKITVAVPIANAPYLFASSFKNYFAATEFVERHLATYEQKMSL